MQCGSKATHCSKSARSTKTGTLLKANALAKHRSAFSSLHITLSHNIKPFGPSEITKKFSSWLRICFRICGPGENIFSQVLAISRSKNSQNYRERSNAWTYRRSVEGLVEHLHCVQSLFRFNVSEILVRKSVSVLDSTVWTSVSIVRAHVIWSVGMTRDWLMKGTNQCLSSLCISAHADPPLSTTLHHLFCSPMLRGDGPRR